MNVKIVLDGAKKVGTAALEIAKKVDWEKVVTTACTVIPAGISICKGIKEVKGTKKADDAANQNVSDDAIETNEETPVEDDPNKEQ